MNMGKPLVSIVLTLYNGERFVRAAMESVLAQTYTDWEMIVVDDASTDGSAAVVSSFVDPRIRVITLAENGQVCNAHRIGDAAAKGRYMAVLDKDDSWEADKLEKQVAWLEEHPETAACFSLATFMDENGDDKKDETLHAAFAASNRSREEWLHELLTTGNHLCHSSAVVRMDALREVGGYNLLYLQVNDYDLWLRLALKHDIHVIQETLVRYRRFDGSGSVSQRTRENDRRMFFEYGRIVGTAVRDMDGGLFRSVFRREMRRKEAESDAEILCEKAILLASDQLVANCKAHAFDLFQAIFRHPERIRTLKERYGMTQHDVYRMTGKPIQYDQTTDAEIRALEREKEEKQLAAAHLNNLLAVRDKRIQVHVMHAKEADKLIRALRGQITRLSARCRKAEGDAEALRASFSWRMTAPARKIFAVLSNLISRNEKVYLAIRLSACFVLHGRAKTVQWLRTYQNEKIARKLRESGYAITAGALIQEKALQFDRECLFSILAPLYNTPEKYLAAMLDSVINQTYGKWELCLADGSDEAHGAVGEICQRYAQRDKRIHYRKLEKNGGISENTNACLEMATGEYIGLLDHDDVLHPFALSENMKAICGEGADFLYSDESAFRDTPADAYWAHHKPDFSPDTLRSYNYICHFTVFRKSLLEKAGGGFRRECDGSQDYDLVLRLTEQAEKIVHIPQVLYYWRSHPESTAADIAVKPYTIPAAKKALAEHLRRVGLKGEVTDSARPSTYRIRYEIEGNPLISIVIPNKDHADDLRTCLDSIRRDSTWSNWEVIVVENNSTERTTFDYYEEIGKDPRIRVVRWEREFNFSAITNFGAKQANGDYLVLLNNDIEAITADWMEQMLMFAQRQDVGAVGAMLYYPDDTVQHAGVILGIRGIAGHSHKNFRRGDSGYARRMTIAQNLSAVTGACTMIPRHVWEEVGGLDESFAVALNDVDLCMKIRRAGYLIVWTPFAELYHYESKSRGLEDTPEKQKRFKDEIDRFQAKWRQELENGDPYYNPHLTLQWEDFSLKT